MSKEFHKSDSQNLIQDSESFSITKTMSSTIFLNSLPQTYFKTLKSFHTFQYYLSQSILCSQSLNYLYLLQSHLHSQMLGWKRSVRDSFKDHSKQSDKSDNVDCVKESDKTEEKLELMFASIKKMLSFLLKIATYQEQLNSNESDIDILGQKVNQLEKKLREEIISMNNIQSIFAFLQMEKKQIQINYLKMLYRRIKMLLRLIIPSQTNILNKMEESFALCERSIESQCCVKQLNHPYFSTQGLLRKYKHQFSGAFCKKNQQQNIQKPQIIDLNSLTNKCPKIVRFFFSIIDIFLHETVLIERRLLEAIKRKQNQLDEVKDTEKTLRETILVDKTINKISDVCHFFRTKQQIMTLQYFLKDFIYLPMEVDKIQVLNNIIPGVQHATNEFLNLDKLKKRNKRIRKDIRSFLAVFEAHKQRKNIGRKRSSEKRELIEKSVNQTQQSNFNPRKVNNSNYKNVRFYSNDSKRISKDIQVRKMFKVSEPKKQIKLRAKTTQAKGQISQIKERTYERLNTKLFTQDPVKSKPNIMRPLRTNNLKLR